MRRVLIAALILTGCHDGPGTKDTSVKVDTALGCENGESPNPWYVDSDGDGYGSTERGGEACDIPAGGAASPDDCDDTDDQIHPDAVELCDGIDRDCDPTTQAQGQNWHADADADGYGDPDTVTTTCTQPPNTVLDATDCNDTDAHYYPGAPEDDCNDPSDYNCDGTVAFYDADGDGTAACVDCDDNDPDRAPTNRELCNNIDDNCDTFVDESTAIDALNWYPDQDGDNYGPDAGALRTCYGPLGYVNQGGDCDDTNATLNPGMEEICNGSDDDCDALIDDNDPSIVGQTTWYQDNDGDGYGGSNSIISCEQPAGYVSLGGDCDDANTAQSPGVQEDCATAVDDNCDGSTSDPNAIGVILFYVDTDGDGYGIGNVGVYACSQQPGFVGIGGDCDDTNPLIYPGATEFCGGGDEDCDGYTDESSAADAVQWYADADGDQYGNPAQMVIACTAPGSYVADNTDCDDSTALAHPGGIEVCDAANRDEDCDGLIDDADQNPSNTSRFYGDADNDGYGSGSGIDICDGPPGMVTNNNDCDDTDATVYPGAYETCDLQDEDCDGLIDDGATAGTWYLDSDGDTYGGRGYSISTCSPPSGYVSNGDDCDDTDAALNPSAQEICNNLDDDCDGQADDNPIDGSTWYLDQDTDNYGNPSVPYTTCYQPFGYVADNTDCNDRRASINPGEAEVCDAYDVDENCNGLVDDNDPTIDINSQLFIYADLDGDGYGTGNPSLSCDVSLGYSSQDGDCNDSVATISPSGAEVCDALNVDEDCDGLSDDADASVNRNTRSAWYIDSDADQYGNISYLSYACDQPSGYVSDATDCNDHESQMNPGMTEICYDGLDNNCDGQAACGLASSVDASSAYATIQGYAAEDRAGYAVASVDDQNGDGYGDIALGAIQSDVNGSNSGGVYVMSGPMGNTTPYSVSSAIYTIGGQISGDRLGEQVTSLDFDGDGDRDIATSTIFEDAGGTSAGATYIVSTPLTSNITLSTSTWRAKLYGESTTDYAGEAIANAGDVDGDGSEDLLIGAYGNDHTASLSGASYLVLGGSTSGTIDLQANNSSVITFRGVAGNEQSGQTVAGLNDIDGDGLADIGIGATATATNGTNSGTLYVILNPTTFSGANSLSGADFQIRGSNASTLGSSAAGMEDIDGDGYDDIAVGAAKGDSNGTDSGSVFIIAGGDILASISAGSTYQTASTLKTTELYGDGRGDEFGTELVAMDYDNDSSMDLVVTAPLDATNGSSAGAAYLFSAPLAGSYSATDANTRVLGLNGNEYLGNSIANAGDVDGDSFEDILIGAYMTDVNGIANVGTAYLFRGGGL